MRYRSRLIVSSALFALLPAMARANIIETLPSLGGQPVLSYSLSGDGTTVVGSAYVTSSNKSGVLFKWNSTTDTALENLGTLSTTQNNKNAAATSVNYNGSIVAGISIPGSNGSARYGALYDFNQATPSLLNIGTPTATNSGIFPALHISENGNGFWLQTAVRAQAMVFIRTFNR